MNIPNKSRLDLLLVERALVETCAKAQALIMEGCVWLNGHPVTKAGTLVDRDTPVQVRSGCPYVSRGGVKLEAALRTWPIQAAGRVCMDVGASTGGFTDCLLQHGAVKIYALDVGYGQLHPRLRTDPRVVVLERTNIRTLDPRRLSERPTLVTVDTSFVSLTKVLPHIAECLTREGEVVALVKPQFEVGPQIAQRGVVRDEAGRRAALQQITRYAQDLRFHVRGSMNSPLRGPKGNVEYLLWLTRPVVTPDDGDSVVV